MPRKPGPLPPVGLLRELFCYDPETGFITNRISRTSRKAGARAESVDTRGYFQVYAGGALRLAHRVAWTMHHGKEPAGFIDHINGDTADNRIANLRECSHSENMRNKRVNSSSRSGIKGLNRVGPSWRANVGVSGQRFHLGSFRSKDEAITAIKIAREKLHGTFSKP